MVFKYISFKISRLKIMTKYFLLLFVAIFLLNIPQSYVRDTQPSVHYVFSQQFDSVLLNCSNDMKGKRKWKHEGEPLFLDRNFVAIHAGDRMKLTPNYSLAIDHLVLTDEGVFECFRDSMVIERYNLTVTVPPDTYVTINGQSTEDLIYVEEAKKLVAVCHANGSKPAASFTWLFNGDVENIYEVNTEISINRENNSTFDARSTVEVLPNASEGNISCITQAFGWKKQKSLTRFTTFAKPWVYLLIDGKDPEKEMCILEGQNLIVACVAIRARPSVTLDIKVNGKRVGKGGQITSSSAQNNELQFFDTKLKVIVEPHGQNGTITCETIGQQSKQSVQAFYCKTDGPVTRKTPVAMVTAVGALSIVLMLSPCIWRYCKGEKRKTTLSFDEDVRNLSGQVEDEYLTPLSASVQATSLCSNDVRRGLSSLENRLTILNLDGSEQRAKGEGKDSKGEDAGPPNLKLPDIPVTDDYNDYSALNDYGYYSKTIAKRARGKIYQRKDICFIVSMKEGYIYNRWMGTIATQNSSNKCVVISSLTEFYISPTKATLWKRSDHMNRNHVTYLAGFDRLLHSKEVQWDVYVKKVLELPSNASNIVRCEGVCIDSGILFLLQEHLTCESLITLIKTNTTKEPRKLVKFCMDTIKGMEYIHSHGFLHPGLSTKKILLTNDGDCKLYDFCLKDDSSSITIVLKDKTIVSLNEFAPEAIGRNEYSWESDVWSIGVVIWDILTCGVQPFPREQNEATISDIEGKLPRQWPECSYPLRNSDLIFDCWKVDVALRPSLKHLKGLFEEGLNLSGPDNSVCRESNIYSSMEETMTSPLA